MDLKFRLFLNILFGSCVGWILLMIVVFGLMGIMDSDEIVLWSCLIGFINSVIIYTVFFFQKNSEIEVIDKIRSIKMTLYLLFGIVFFVIFVPVLITLLVNFIQQVVIGDMSLSEFRENLSQYSYEGYWGFFSEKIKAIGEFIGRLKS